MSNNDKQLNLDDSTADSDIDIDESYTYSGPTKVYRLTLTEPILKERPISTNSTDNSFEPTPPPPLPPLPPNTAITEGNNNNNNLEQLIYSGDIFGWLTQFWSELNIELCQLGTLGQTVLVFYVTVLFYLVLY